MSHKLQRFQSGEVTAWTLVLVAVFCLTIAKAHIDGGALWDASVQARREVRLMPFEEFYRRSTVWYGPWVNLVGNIALFAPVGFLAYRRPLLTGLTLSVVIEATQYLTYTGYTDIDDLMFNTVGAVLGGWVASRVGPRSRGVIVGILALGALAVVVAFATRFALTCLGA
ncbi:VanZ family protein [Corynebacterium sp. LK2510]|uniref:VanZ family protein n=1 Tax=Corynebacterium sp. LK2510 TaxID=3110472 RepID=UPI0034CF0AC1